MTMMIIKAVCLILSLLGAAESKSGITAGGGAGGLGVTRMGGGGYALKFRPCKDAAWIDNGCTPS